MTKKSLQAWYNSGDISSSQKEIIQKFGVGDYYPEHELKDFKKIWYWDDILKRNRNYINRYNEINRVKKMLFFSSWWNNNLLIFINETNRIVDVYEVYLIVYEMPTKSGDTSTEILKTFFINDYQVDSSAKNFENAKNKVYELKAGLEKDKPICYYRFDINNINYSQDYDSSSYPMTFGLCEGSEVVGRIELPSDARYNPDKYILPLDIVLAINKKMVHACVYLGDKKVCHVLSEGGGKVKIESWDSFLSVISADKIIRYHPVIPFKKTDIIIRHIAKSIEGKTNYFLPGVKNRDGSFSLWNTGNARTKSLFDDKGDGSNNCENFTNACVLGLNFSELADRRGGRDHGYIFSSTRCTEGTNKKLDALTSYTPYSKIREIEGYKNQGKINREPREVLREGIKMENYIEIEPKSWYKFN